MPTAHTIATVKNMALDAIGELPLDMQPGGDGNAYARWLARNYTPTVRTALRRTPWNFAVEAHQLNRAADPPFRWRYAYDLPPGWLRVLQPTKGGVIGGQPVKYAVMGQELMTDFSGDMKVLLIMDRQEPGVWDDLFANYVAAVMANGMAHRFTAKSSYVQLTAQMAKDAYDVAEEVNTMEGTLEDIEQFDIIRARHGYNPSDAEW